MKTLKDMDVKGKKVLVRADFNVVGDNSKIIASLPTINYLLDKDCRVILMSHLGRPKGKVVEEFRLDDVAQRLSRLLGKSVLKLNQTVGSEVSASVENMQAGDVVLLENVQFNPGEKGRYSVFAKQLAELADIFVLDAFGQAHRDYASLTMIQEHLPSCAGLLLEREVKSLSSLLENPKHPFVAVLGGAKVSDKVKLIESLLEKVDKLLIGGAMAFTLLRAKNISVGKSLVEEDFDASKLLESKKIVLQKDAVITQSFDENAEKKTVPIESIEEDWMGLDIGPQTIELFKKELEEAKTVVWNGPMGVFEFDRFAEGTTEMAKCISTLDAMTVIGGGDTLAAAKKAHVSGKFTHISTGGGAMLEFLQGKKLPALEALEQAN